MLYKYFTLYADEKILEEIDELCFSEGFYSIFSEVIDSNLWRVKVYLEPDQEFPPFLSGYPFELGGEELEENWWKKFKENLKPFMLTHHTKLIPLEEPNQITEEGALGIVPGSAFGTGLHETTKLASRLLEKHMEPGAFVLDVGSGTGILSALALKRGAKKAVALDIDPAAVEKCQETAWINGVSIDARVSNFLSALKPGERFNVIVSNMIVELLERFVKETTHYLKSDGVIILSGILKEKFDAFVTTLEDSFSLLETEEMNEWKAAVLKKR
ncbi:hypothetical protein AT15_00940 [Kosmotoga arenicorallina S304]|uniref:Ribosomal protein L11 methyltransferase n=1 Tax=Kosmotoga arenicorallina S304 TaxID=1453497 RepID=A0A176K0I5_9BACT|nr:50S ribosomal protein L11 methyltransferase [Kosmotoga arenicorallina]OAA30112.1 hypothetical protein AT15_00940 [Kosmotoga arenicorallina S304]